MKFIKTILVLTIIGLSLLFITGEGHLLKAAWITYLQGEFTVHINDINFFDTNKIEGSTIEQEFKNHPQKNDFIMTETLKKEHERLRTAGFIVLKDGEILHESYMNGYTKDSLTNGFSMTKTIVTMLLGFAIQDGFVKSLDQPITDFIPEFTDKPLAKNVSIGDFSSMTSGYYWTKEYFIPFNNPNAKAYFGKNIEKQIVNGDFSKERGKQFMYSSGDTQLLGIAIRRASKKDLADYASEKLWKPLGISADAEWGLDDKETGVEKAFCCLYANTKSWAKIGQLLLQNGKWEDKQILDSAFVERMRTPVNNPNYGFSLWLDLAYKTPFYLLSGVRGQRVIIIPSKNIVIARLGEENDKTVFIENGIAKKLETDIYVMVDEVMKSLDSLKL